MSRRNENCLDLFTLLVQIYSVTALWAIVGELFCRTLTALAKRTGASKQLVRTVRDGIRTAWIVAVGPFINYSAEERLVGKP